MTWQIMPVPHRSIELGRPCHRRWLGEESDFHTGVQLFGSDSLITIMAPGWIFYGVAAAAGPIVAYCVSQNRIYRGRSEAGAYNPFFYAAAGLSFGNFLLVATMGWLERRAVAAEHA